MNTKPRVMSARKFNLMLLGIVIILSLLAVRHFHYARSVEDAIFSIQRLMWTKTDNPLHRDNRTSESTIVQERIIADTLSILMWVNYSGWHITNEQLSSCMELNCDVTFNRSILPRASAVVLYDRMLEPDDLPPRQRPPNQHYVFFLMESAHYVSRVAFTALSRNFYTLTMSYRRDSDLFSPYGFLRARKKPLKTPDDVWKSIALSKPKGAVWMASYCSTASNRETYIAWLKRYLDLDVYGWCGHLRCPKTSTAYMKEDYCEQMLKKNYKFYIAFENSMCKDFMTEKVFNRLDSHLVPILFKRSFAEQLLPNGSFIAADDFEGPKELADYLNYLSKNWTAYIEYYRWKDYYEVVPFPGGLDIGMCQLCARLRADHDLGVIYPTESAADIKKWFIGRSECIANYGLHLSRGRNSKTPPSPGPSPEEGKQHAKEQAVA